MDDPDILKPPRAVAPRLVWENRLTMLAAREKGGKSTLAGAAAAAISSGQSFLGEDTVPGNVLIIALEEHPQEFVQRLVKFRADPRKVAILSGSGGPNLIENIRRAAEEVEPALIIWDTLGAFADHVRPGLEPNDSSGWTAVMMEILEITRAYGASLLLHHTKKSDGKYRDSTAIGANVDAIIEMFGEDQEPRTLKTKARFHVPDLRLKLENDEFVVLQTKEEIDQKVLAFVASNARCSVRDIRDGVDGRNPDIDASRKRLLAANRITNVGNAAKHSYMAVR